MSKMIVSICNCIVFQKASERDLKNFFLVFHSSVLPWWFFEIVKTKVSRLLHLLVRGRLDVFMWARNFLSWMAKWREEHTFENVHSSSWCKKIFKSSFKEAILKPISVGVGKDLCTYYTRSLAYTRSWTANTCQFSLLTYSSFIDRGGSD